MRNPVLFIGCLVFAAMSYKVPVILKDTSTHIKNTDTTPRIAAKPEMNIHRKLPPGTIRLIYRESIDTIHGFRNGDTLFTEGDIKMNYPPSGIRGVAGLNNLWPVSNLSTPNNKIVIPFEISPQFSQAFRDKITAAMKMWSHLLKVDFKPHTFQLDYIEFVPSSFTQSFVGRVGTRQTIELGSDASAGNIAHEIGHALGLYHENTRLDRDQFITVAKNCSDDLNYQHAFKQNPFAKDLFSYSYTSIMHYPAAPLNPCLVMPAEARQKFPPTIPGQRDSVTVGDVATVVSIYNLK